MVDKLFYADFMYGSPNLAKFEVTKETSKMYFVRERESIMGIGKWARRLYKDDEHIFLDPIDAVSYLLVQSVKRHNSLIDSIEDNMEVATKLRNLLEHLKNEKSKEVVAE